MLLLLLAAPDGAHARDLVVATTGEAALQPPMIVLGIGGRPAGSSGPSKNPLEDLGIDLPAVAILDTGASGHVLSHGSAIRFGVEAEPGSRYVEAGMSGDHAMEVSRALTLTATDLDPADDGASRGRRSSPATYRLASQRVLLNDAPADPGALLLSPGAMVDVVGMPLIRERVVEIVPGDDDAGAVAVRLHPSAAGLGVDAWIPLALTDFNRRDPRNRGPVPSLAENPLVEDVRVERGAADAAGAWLLDTGAVCSMISTSTARALGLVDSAGAPTRRPDFTLPVGGIGGGHTSLPGFRLDRLTIAADGDRALVFERPAVVVHDVTTTRADGAKVTLDGILGMNLLLPSGTGLTMLGAARQLPSRFARIVIDARGERLGVKLR
ncbi:MAG: retropepsin-like domain-containing protein [Deltaproteobacteria bacterium]|nr:retropepsin-like domain-containing protein [Deltaproteobacteria bacterium]